MAMLATKSPYNASLGSMQTMPSRQFSGSSQRVQAGPSALQDGMFASPTESEFSEVHDGLDSVRVWTEDDVAEWLRSIKCGQYQELFKQNNFTGDTLLECDQKMLAEMGIKKIGDRVKINVAIKQLRNKSTARKRHNRDSMALLDSFVTLGSPRLYPGSEQLAAGRVAELKSSSRPSSPLADGYSQSLRGQKYVPVPMDLSRSTSGPYFTQPNSANTVTGKKPETPSSVQGFNTKAAPYGQLSSGHGMPSIDHGTSEVLSTHSPVIKVIYGSGQTKVVQISGCKTADEITGTVLKRVLSAEKGKLFRNYCFYMLQGVEADPRQCRRISDDELVDICRDPTHSARNRLILRKINDGPPDHEELSMAAHLAYGASQAVLHNALHQNNGRSADKIIRSLGATAEEVQGPISPALVTDWNRNILATADEYDEYDASRIASDKRSHRASKLRTFFGARPPSEMIVQELTSYFPDHKTEDIEKTMQMSVRRSQRMSRVASRLSVVSNLSTTSSLRDAPPVPAIPNIADTWSTPPSGGLTRVPGSARPLSVSRFGLPGASYRDSVASSTLQPLQEESPIEPNRKSYVSFADSEPEPDSATTNDGHSSFGDSHSPLDQSNAHLSVLMADGEEDDAVLTSFLAGNQFDRHNWMKGDLIGEGSFGSVYLALHAVTGELMAVKQVELPSTGAVGSESDKKRTTMISALKQEIDLLQGLHHPHIVQYLGTSSDDTHLNIFLEYVPGGSIAGMLKQYNTFGEILVRNFTRQILEGLSYLHKHNIIHRDIKGANILVDNRGAVKISDFGVSKKQGFNGSNAPGARTSLQGSVFWMAPEVVRQTGQSIKSDIWSVGCLIVEMFTGSRPFPLMTTVQTLFAVGSNGQKPSIPDTASDAAREFLELTFEVDPEERPGAEELLREKFMQNLQ